jgi:hypothetical protein
MPKRTTNVNSLTRGDGARAKFVTAELKEKEGVGAGSDQRQAAGGGQRAGKMMTYD